MAKDLPVDILVSKGRYWLLLDGTGSLYCGTGWYLVILGRNRAVLVASVICFQKIYGLHGVNHQIIQYSEKEKVMTKKWTNKQTDTISYLRLDLFHILHWSALVWWCSLIPGAREAHFLLSESLLFIKLSHLRSARAGNTRFNKVRHDAPMLCISFHSFTDVY